MSHVWTEAEPVAEGVKPPSSRDWFKRVKVRFDWVDSQGVPWWEQASGTPPIITNLATEVAQSPQARRVAVAELVGPSDGNPGSSPRPTHLQHQDTVSSSCSSYTSETAPKNTLGHSYKGKESAHSQHQPVDPQSGLLTPPITPTTLEGDCNGATTTDLDQGAHIAMIGEAVASGSQPTRRRLPGDHVLASFGDTITLSDHDGTT